MSAVEDLLMMGQIPALGEAATRQELRDLDRKLIKFAPQILVRHANDIGFTLYRTEVIIEYLRGKDPNFGEEFIAAEKRVRDAMEANQHPTVINPVPDETTQILNAVPDGKEVARIGIRTPTNEDTISEDDAEAFMEDLS
jgi:hypothetical protein